MREQYLCKYHEFVDNLFTVVMLLSIPHLTPVSKHTISLANHMIQLSNHMNAFNFHKFSCGSKISQAGGQPRSLGQKPII